GPAGSPLVEVGGKTVAVSVAAAELTILEPERVRRADNLGRFILLLKQRECSFLVRDCDVAAGNAFPADFFDEGGKMARRNFAPVIRSGDLVGPEPMVVDQ